MERQNPKDADLEQAEPDEIQESELGAVNGGAASLQISNSATSDLKSIKT